MTNVSELIIERLPNPGIEGWNPIVPTFDNLSGNAGIDFHSAHRVEATVAGYKVYKAIIRTGLRLHLPYPFHMRIASRSGLGFKRNIVAFPGTIDNSYRGELIIKLTQISDIPEPFIIEAGERVAQGILFLTPQIVIKEGTVSTDTSRGESGFGSTGV